MKVLTATFTGIRPLLQHNERLANPMDPIVEEMKQLTGKRKKTKADFIAIAEVEFRGGLYIDKDLGPYIPGKAIRAALIGSAKKAKLGRQVVENVFVMKDKTPIQYDGPRTADGLWKAGFYDQRMVGNQKQRVLRTRPLFNQWAVDVEVHYDEAGIDDRQMQEIVIRAGTLGMGDYRPLFGTFSAEAIKIARAS